LFSFIEASFLSVSAVKASSLVSERRRGAKALFRLKQQPRRLIIAILFSNTLVNFTAVAIATTFFSGLFPNSGIWIATLVMTAVVLIFGQIMPKIIAENQSVPIALFFAHFAEILIKILTPIVYLIEKMLSEIDLPNAKATSENEFKTMINKSRQDGIISKKTAKLMDNIVDFETMPLSNVMTPRKNIMMLNAEEKISDVLEKVLHLDITRFPVYEKEENHIIGVVSLTDILRAIKNRKKQHLVKSIVQKAIIMPESKKTSELLSEFESQDYHLAIIVNEYGYITGVVTVQDILKVLVETEKEEQKPLRRVIVKGKTEILEVSKILNVKIDSESKTIAGYIEENLQRIPLQGEKFSIRTLAFEVLKASLQEIEEVKITHKI